MSEYVDVAIIENGKKIGSFKALNIKKEKAEKKDEIKNKISMALKDPILQQGFECICKENAELKAQFEKLLDFAAERTEMCDVCPQTDNCINSEGGCPYAALDEETATRKWIKHYIQEKK